MNFRRLAAALLLLPATAAAQGVMGLAPMRVLFIGNSYTYVNDLPMVIADLAGAAHEARAFRPDVVLVGGSTLEAHLTRPDALPAIAHGGWDGVVLQEQSTRPITDPDKFWRDVKTFAQAATKANARLYLYETWAREADPRTQDSLTHVYHKAAESVGATVIPVGEVWAAFRAQEGAVPAGAHSVLFRADGSHPSPVGTYLAATVMFETFYGRSAAGLPPLTRITAVGGGPPPGPAPDAARDSVPSGLAKRIQDLAARVGR